MNEDWEIENTDRDISGDDVCLNVKHKEGFCKAYIKWDGCCEITQYEDEEMTKEDFSIHLCDVPRFIAILQSLEQFRMEKIKDAE